MTDSHLFLEPCGTAAFHRLRGLISEAKAADVLAPVTVAVPSQYAGLSLRRSLASGHGLVNVRFMVPSRLAEYLGSPALAGLKKAPLSPLIEHAAIRAVAEEMTGEGPLGPVAQHPRLHSSLGRTFRDLGRLSEEDLAGLEQTDPLRAQTVRWYRLFRDRLRGYYDREELAWAAAEAVEDGKASSALRDLGFIIFHLVQAFSPGEAALVKALGSLGHCQMVLGFVGEEDADAGAMGAASAMAPVMGPARSSPHTQAGCDIDHLVSAPDAHEEIKWVVRHIARRAEGGLPFHRVAVLYRQSDPYASLVPNQLRLAGIPAAGPDPTPLRDTPAGRLLESLISALESDFSRDAVMRCLAESPVRVGPGSQSASSELARWEIISRKAGVVKGATQWRERVTRYRDHLAERIAMVENLEEVSPSSLKGLQELIASASSLLAFIGRLGGHPPPAHGSRWSAFGAWARGLLAGLAADPDQWPAEHRAGYDRVLSLLDDIAGLDAVSPGADPAGFRVTLNDALATPAGRTGLTGSGVFVAPVQAAVGMSFDAVYMVGMAEGSFPPQIADDPVLPDRVRETVGDGARLPLRQGRRGDERRLFLTALASGVERVLSYPRSDPSAQRAQYPSSWFLDAAGRRHGTPVGSADVTKLVAAPWLSLIHSSQHSLEFAERLTPADAHDYDVATVARWRALGHRLDKHYLASPSSTLGRTLSMDHGRQGTGFTAWDGRLSQLAGQSRRLSLPADGEISPTRLERWAACPFRYFMADVLGLSALERPEEVLSISPLDRGVVLHDILERFVKGVMQRAETPGYGGPWDDGHRKLLLGIAEEEFDKAEGKGVTGKPLLWQATKEEMRQDLIAFLEEDSRWRARLGSRPLWAERLFGCGDDDGLPPVTLTLPGGGQVRFRGRIDRVDQVAGGSKVVVIDYKSGGTGHYKDMSRDPLGGGRFLQLPVYALAARSAAGSPVDVEAHYWFVTARGQFERKTVPLTEVEGRFLDIVAGIASGIQQGLFPANPGPSTQDGKSENCRHCDFDRICPANRDVLWDRKRGNAELTPYLCLLGPAGAEEAGE